MIGTPDINRLGTPASMNCSYSSLGFSEGASPASPAMYARNNGLGLPPSPGFPFPVQSPDPSSPYTVTSTRAAFDDINEKGSYRALAVPATSTDVLAKFEADADAVRKQKQRQYGSSRRKCFWIVGVTYFFIAAAAGGITAFFIVRSKMTSEDDISGTYAMPVDDTSNHHDASIAPEAPKWGADGSTVLMSNGTTFTYHNPFGGYWVAEPYNNSARAQSWTKPLAEQWDYSTDKIYGVNLGGWLTIEPFIVPSLFEPYEKVCTGKHRERRS